MNILSAGRMQKGKKWGPGGKGSSQMMIVVFMLIVMVIMDDDVVRDWAPPKSFCRESYDMWCQPKWWWGGSTAPRI